MFYHAHMHAVEVKLEQIETEYDCLVLLGVKIFRLCLERMNFLKFMCFSCENKLISVFQTDHVVVLM